MVCPKCKGEVAKGSPRCPHCGVKFVVRPKPAPARNEQDQLWGEEPAKPPPAPPSPVPAAPPRPARGGRILYTGRPSTIGTSFLADHIKAVGGAIVGLVILVGLGIRTYLRWNRPATAQWQTVEDQEVTIPPQDSEVGKVNSEIKGTYLFEVQARDREVSFGILKIAGKEPTSAEVDALMSRLKTVAPGQSEVLTGPVEKAAYIWMVRNSTDQPARVHLRLKGGED